MLGRTILYFIQQKTCEIGKVVGTCLGELLGIIVLLMSGTMFQEGVWPGSSGMFQGLWWQWIMFWIGFPMFCLVVVVGLACTIAMGHVILWGIPCGICRWIRDNWREAKMRTEAHEALKEMQ